MPTKMGEAVSLIIVAEVLINKPFKGKNWAAAIGFGICLRNSTQDLTVGYNSNPMIFLTKTR